MNEAVPPSHAGVGSAPRVPLLLRAVILGLHWHGGMTFHAISMVLGVNERTASPIVRRAKDRAANPGEFEDVLACLDDEHGGGRPTRIADDSETSIALRDLLQQDEIHWQMAFENIAKELGIGNLTWSTLKHIFHDHHEIFRRKATHKSFLSAKHMETSLAFAHMARHIAMNHSVFIDEMWVEFNSIRRAYNVSRTRGGDPNEWAIHDKEVSTIRVMFCGAICMGQRGPHHILEQETEEDQLRHQAIIAEENALNLRRKNVNQAQAAIPGTWQYAALEQINANIDQQNIREGREGQRKRRQRGPHEEFKEDQFIYHKISRGDINWVSYREKVLRPLLYPWIDEIEVSTGMPLTYRVEDNAPSHQTVQRVDREKRIFRGIITFKWPSKFSDMNQIELIWSDEKDEIATYQFTGASMETVRQAKETLIRVWEELPQALIDRRCATFHEKLE